MEKSWFEMRREIRRKYADYVWIPLKSSIDIQEGEHGQVGYRKEYEFVRSLLIPLSKRLDGSKISWSDTAHDHVPYAHDKGYKPAEIYEIRTGKALGIEPVLCQNFSLMEDNIWRLNQDIVIALELKEEGDSWLCPNEGYIEVAKLGRDGMNNVNSISMRSEFLKDYLAARRMALRITSYRQRMAVIEDATGIVWSENPERLHIEGGRFEGRAYDIHEGGELFGAKAAVFHVSRNDLDFEDDVPILGDPTDENITSNNWTKEFSGRRLSHVEGEFWRDEWVEPAKESPRVRGDKISSNLSFFVEADGRKAAVDELNDQEVGRWLWFSIGIMQNILDNRGSNIEWYSRNTGAIALTPSYPVHFGINEKGLINIYAYDVAKLPEWQRHVWSGFNIAPDGRVSKELLQAQVDARPASTQAPEDFLERSLTAANSAFIERWDKPLLRMHESTQGIIRKAHRFRAIDDAGVYSLAKDIARLTADSFDLDTLHSIVPLSKGEKRGSIKSLERVMSTVVGDERARQLTGPLVGAYELRLGDAHLPSSKISEAFELAKIDRAQSYIEQGRTLLHMIVSVMLAIEHDLRSEQAKVGD